jgi:polysaccharide pyruvyl transferase WcaK-like protein
MTVVLSPHGGSGNHGCEAIVRATGLILGPGVDITLFTHNEAQDRLYGLDSCCTLASPTEPIRRFSSRWLAARMSRRAGRMDELAFDPIARAARRSDIVMSIGGDNYCYGVNRHLLLANRIARRAGAKTVLWGCSVEADALDNREVADDLAAFDLIIARESVTRDTLVAAGITNVTLRPDPAFALPRRDEPLPPGFVEFAGSGDGGAGTVGINISPMIIGHEQQSGATLASYERLIEHILADTEMAVALVPHVVWPHNDDRVPLETLHRKFAHTGRVVMVADAPAEVLKGVIARCRFFVAARTHASIAAYSQQVPTLVVGYSVKARGIARDIFGTDRGYVVPVQSLVGGCGCMPDSLVSAFDSIRRREDRIRAHYAAMMPHYKAAAHKAKNDLSKL